MKYKEKCPIGVFDSGYGGLTVLKEIVKALPQYDYIYLGDNARAPYGCRSYDTVFRYTEEAVKKLFEMGCRLVILACNTASAKALRSIQQTYLPTIDNGSRRVLGVIRPSVEKIGSFTKNNHIGIIATTGTVNSLSYPMEIEKLYGCDNIHVTQMACPLLAPLVENAELTGVGTEFFVKKYLDSLFKADSSIDTLILGCTHYPLLRDVIEKFIPKGVSIIEQGNIVAESLMSYLQRHSEIESVLSKSGEVRYYTTEVGDAFNRMAGVFLDCRVEAQHINIEIAYD